MKKIALLCVIALFANVTFAFEDEIVTLTVSGQGMSQTEARQNALRNAIEQAYGTFISSNTEILNDDLVKDEIVSVSSGNIQNFEVLSEVQIPDGGFATTLQATVSVSNLTSFVESKGVVVAFNGGILAANVRHQMLNEKNEIKSIENIAVVCKEILDYSCDFSIVSGDPKQKNNDNNSWSVPITINVKFNNNIDQFSQHFLNSIKGLAMSKDEVSQYEQLGKRTYKIALGGNSIAGHTTSIKYLKKNIAPFYDNLTYKIICLSSNGTCTEVFFESDDIRKIARKFKQLILGRSFSYTNPQYCGWGALYQIEYYDKTTTPIYHFRTMSAVASIIDLILYSKHAVLNFQINNGIDILNPEIFFADITKYNSRNRWNNVQTKNYKFKITGDYLTPLYGFSLFGTHGGYPNYYNYPRLTLYEPYHCSSNNTRYSYNGDRNDNFHDEYSLKYTFLTQADRELPPRQSHGKRPRDTGYQVAISMYDFKVDGNFVNTFYYEDVLTLSEIERVTGYEITPISHN